MAPAETLLVAAFDSKKLRYVVPGHPDMDFPGEDAARRAGCIVMPQGPRAGDVGGLSSTELSMLVQVGARPLVITRIPGTIHRPPCARPELSGSPPQPTTTPARRRGGRS